MVRDETAWTWWTLPPAISGCFAREVSPAPTGLFPSVLDYRNV
jgi:hypothetical protein